MEDLFLKKIDFSDKLEEWKDSRPFNHIVIDNFLENKIAKIISEEFPKYENKDWKIYNNFLEVKKLQNHWDKFGPTTYRLFTYLNSRKFVDQLELFTGCKLYADIGLNGGGLHTHKRGGKLNPHLDYSMHPKLKLERRLNLIIYVTPKWEESWGGQLGLWEEGKSKNIPGKLKKSVTPFFNRAILFDTSNSWHGLPEPIMCPKNITRNSVTVYYLCDLRPGVEDRGKALFAPYKDQINDPEVLSLIKKRASTVKAKDVYGDK